MIEILVTFTVLAVMLTLAAPSFVAFQRNAELSSAANGLMSAMAVARSEAMKRQLDAFVEPAVGDDWSGGWVAYIDVNSSHDGYQAGSDVLLSRGAALPASVEVNLTPSANGFVDATRKGRPYVLFVGSGFMRRTDGSFITVGVLQLHSVGSDEVRCVTASPSGRMRVFRPSGGSCSADTLTAGS